MNEQDIELELRRLRPGEPSSELSQRVEDQLRFRGLTKPSRSRFSLAPWWIPLAAAALFVVLAAVSTWLLGRTAPRAVSTPPTEKTAGTVPGSAGDAGSPAIQAANYLVGAEEEGIVYASDKAPYRKIRYQWVASRAWSDEQDHTVVQVLQPREETILVPLNIH